MKKILSIALAVALMLSLSVTAMADGLVTADSTATIDISASYKAGATAGDVISVDIAWGAMAFEYTDGAEGAWDPATHTQGTKGAGSWSAGGNEITLTNHSNVGVKAAFAYTKAVETVTGTFSGGGSLSLATAVGTTRDAAPSGSVALTLGGTLTAETAGKVGTVTVTIEKT